MKSLAFMLCLTICFCTWMVLEYNQSHIAQYGYTAEYRARMDDLIAGVTPLSVADLGMEAE